MYHCGLKICFVGDNCVAFDVMRAMPPLPNFTHNFVSSADGADVVIANAASADDLRRLTAAKRDDSQLILLATAEALAQLGDIPDCVDELWTLPMTEAEVRFRFAKWQRGCKSAMESWQTAQYLDATIGLMPSLVWYKDKSGVYHKVNRSFSTAAGKSMDDIPGSDSTQVWGTNATEGDMLKATDNEVMTNRALHISGLSLHTPNGNEMHLRAYKAPLYDIDGSVMGTVGVGVDVTREHEFESALVSKTNSLERIFTSLDCGILCHTVSGDRVISVNDAALRLLGYDSEDDLVRDGFKMVAQSVLDEDKPKLRECIQSLKTVGDSANIEYRVLHKDGKLLHIMGNIKLLRENDELFYQRFLLDCTEEKEIEQRQSDLVQALSMDYGLVCYFDLNTGAGRAIRVDAEKNRLSDGAFNGDITLKQSMGKYIDALVYEEDKQLMLDAIDPEKLMNVLGDGLPIYTNYRTLRDGQIRYFEMKIVPSGNWSTDHGIVLGLRSVDETTRRDMEQRRLLEEALEQANRASAAKTSFLSNMSHDIRTPMNAILGFTNLSISHIDDKERVLEYLEKIVSSSEHMLDLLNGVLDMSRIESGKMQLTDVPCSMKDILEELANIEQNHVQTKGLDFTITNNVRTDGFMCDKTRLNQVILNVVENSIKYTPAGGSVSVTVEEPEGAPQGCVSYRFTISDTGIGMSKEFLEKIFVPFEREHNTTTVGVFGAGLGMSITKTIVDMMKGRITIDSEQGKGTTTTIFFTFNALDGEHVEAKPVETNDHTQRSGRILLVEDNEFNTEIAVAILEDAGFEVECAENGRVAVDKVFADPSRYKLVLMDIQMPVMNGYEATEAIRASDNLIAASIPIIAMTANAFDEDRRNALRSGMNGHIAKPIDVHKLFAAMDEIMRR